MPTARTCAADPRPGLLQRRPVLLAGRQARHLPQRPQEERPPAALRHQQRRHRRAGLDRRSQLGPLGPLLVQGRQAHRLHRGRPQQPGHAAQLRSLLDEHGNGQDSAADLRSRCGRAAGVQPGWHQVDVDLDPRRRLPRPSSTSRISRCRKSECHETTHEKRPIFVLSCFSCVELMQQMPIACRR